MHLTVRIVDGGLRGEPQTGERPISVPVGRQLELNCTVDLEPDTELEWSCYQSRVPEGVYRSVDCREHFKAVCLHAFV